MATSSESLDIKRTKFAKSYLKDGNATKAAIVAGYSKNGASVTGHQLLRNPKIRKIIEKSMAEAIRETGVGLNWRLELLKKGAEACMNRKTTKDKVVDISGLLGVVGEINKMGGDYAPTQSTSNVKLTSTENLESIVEECEKVI